MRLWADIEARDLGDGGVSTVAKAVGISRTTIYAGLAELDHTTLTTLAAPNQRVRTQGGGQKKLTRKDPTLLRDLDALVDPTSRADPMVALRWTCKSTPRLAKELQAQGHAVSQRTVCDLLAQMGYGLQSTRKTREDGNHPDREDQFQHIASQVAQCQAAGDPVISVDTKAKELDRRLHEQWSGMAAKGKPEEVRVYDFIDPDLGKVAPYGVYDLTANQGWVSVGIDHDTAEFAVESIRRGAGDGATALSQDQTPADLQPTVEAAVATGCACGVYSCRNWQMNWG
ncbi:MULTISPECIES: ISAzo13 family transposase [Nitrosomonas]|uniref:DDE family transposase n=1 Tax=Nitrosomonas communis TaxID=44574 RepID=A0A5D3YBB0_9PROT|nr:DDE family transposase [Nitrosomonas communis]